MVKNGAPEKKAEHTDAKHHAAQINRPPVFRHQQAEAAAYHRQNDNQQCIAHRT